MLDIENYKERKDERILVLRPVDGQKPKSSTGLVDSRLFTGENQLKAILNRSDCLWAFRYDQGGLPPQLKQKFTTFAKLFEHAKTYFASRNIEIAEVKD